MSCFAEVCRFIHLRYLTLIVYADALHEHSLIIAEMMMCSHATIVTEDVDAEVKMPTIVVSCPSWYLYI